MHTDVASHIASVAIDTAPDVAFGYIANPRHFGEWSLGGFHVKEITRDSYSGHSLIDGQALHVRIEPDPARGLIHFWTGPAPERLRNLILARIVPGEMADLGPQSCILSLISWAPASMTPARWRQLCAAHETEMFILKNRIEAFAMAQARVAGSGSLAGA